MTTAIDREFAVTGPPAQRLRQEIAAGRGVRIGETAVLSTRVHLVDRARPDTVTVSLSSDAGRAFYGWAAPGQVYHLDLFHADAEIPPEAVAAALRAAAEHFWPGRNGAEIEARLDRFDVQTGAGGGRATGSLHFGRRETLRAAHRNHVHVAARLDPSDLPFFLYAVAEIEQAILRRGVEIRRVRRLVHQEGGAPVDLSDYVDCNDSRLRPDGQVPPGRQGTGRGDAGGRARSGAGGEGAAGPSLTTRELADLADAAGGLAQLAAALERLAGGVPRGDWARESPRSWPPLALVRRLQEDGLAVDERGRLGLTARGEALRGALRGGLRQLEARIRQAFRRPAGRAPRIRPALCARGAAARVPAAVATGVAPRAERPRADLDLNATALAAARRCLTGGGPGRTRIRVAVEDLRVRPPRPAEGRDVCLLIDCSASMAGKRMAAAKFLARHLLLTTRDRVAVLAFQETEVRLAVPFTRRYRLVDEGLAALVPSGLTPMARGLVETCDYLRRAHARRALLLLVTDGIPTVPRWTINPIEDAMRAAESVARARIAFGCIGLEPSRTYLEAIARRGNGRLYVLDDLDEASLAGIARQELATFARRW